MDLRGSIPTVVHIDDGKSYDTDILDVLIPEAGAFYVIDRGFFDLQRLHRLAQAAAFFVIRAKTNLQFRRVYSHAANNPQQSWGFEGEPPEAVTKDSGTRDGTS
jgi:hypothetical protein